jgi:hypothetical protein
MAQNEIRFGLELTIEGSKIAECKKLVQDMVKVLPVIVLSVCGNPTQDPCLF